jgi:cleavage and polyadenylation specificity factor subunit 3
MDGRKLPLRLSVAYISFSAHVDYAQNTEFIKLVDPKTLVGDGPCTPTQRKLVAH